MDRGVVARSEVRSVCVIPRSDCTQSISGFAVVAQVMYSKYVTQTQLWQFMRHNGYD